MDKIKIGLKGQEAFAWKYDITWYTYKYKKIFKEAISKEIVGLLKESCQELEIVLIGVEITPNTIRFFIGAECALGANKTLKTLRKRFGEKYIACYDSLRSCKEPLWESNELIIEVQGERVTKDIRKEKFLEEVTEIAYYDLDECLGEEMEDFKAYLNNKNLAVINYGKYTLWVDREALVKTINLNCFECTKRYRYGCCCGSPCEMSSKNLKRLKKHMRNIEEEMKRLDEKNYDTARQAGGLVLKNGMINEYDGRCALLVEHEGVGKCLVHKYALEQDIPVYDICPLSCLMYPLEIMELIADDGRKVFVFTSVVEEYIAREFGRWGSYEGLDIDLKCIHSNAHDEGFKAQDYKPVYKVNEKLISHEFGESVYNGLENLFENKML